MHIVRYRQTQETIEIIKRGADAGNLGASLHPFPDIGKLVVDGS